MKTTLVMTSSALLMITAGAALLFAPQELASAAGASGIPVVPVYLQLLGGLLFASGMVNWTARENLIGGVYGRPIAIGNLAHFTIGTLMLVRSVPDFGDSFVWWGALSVYALFAAAFSVIFFRHPAATDDHRR